MANKNINKSCESDTRVINEQEIFSSLSMVYRPFVINTANHFVNFLLGYANVFFDKLSMFLKLSISLKKGEKHDFFVGIFGAFIQVWILIWFLWKS